MAAKQRLTKGRTKARQRKMHLIARLLDLPSTVTTVHQIEFMMMTMMLMMMPGVHVMPEPAPAHAGLPEGGGGAGAETAAHWGGGRTPHQAGGAEGAGAQGPGGSSAGHKQVRYDDVY